MKSKITIYLAGSIKKGHEKNDESYWSDESMAFLKQCLQEYEISFLNPAFRNMLILGAAMRKLAHIIYGVLKSGKEFDSSLAINNP